MYHEVFFPLQLLFLHVRWIGHISEPLGMKIDGGREQWVYKVVEKKNKGSEQKIFIYLNV